jgi:hypothetical protein
MKTTIKTLLVFVALAATVPAVSAPALDQTPRFFIIIDRDGPPPTPPVHKPQPAPRPFWPYFGRWVWCMFQLN